MAYQQDIRTSTLALIDVHHKLCGGFRNAGVFDHVNAVAQGGKQRIGAQCIAVTVQRGGAV